MTNTGDAIALVRAYANGDRAGFAAVTAGLDREELARLVARLAGLVPIALASAPPQSGLDGWCDRVLEHIRDT